MEVVKERVCPCASDKSLLHDEWSSFGVVRSRDLGDRAGIKWVASTCGICQMCTNGKDELHCPKQANSGFTAAGTYATHILEGVKDEEEGRIMCGGVTAYVACNRSVVRPGQWIVLPGAGGGLGHFAVQYAKAMGMRVIAVDGGAEKEKLCRSLGAEEFIDFTTCKDIATEAMRITTWESHGVLVTAASKEGYATTPMLLRPGGTMVAVGLPNDPTVMTGLPIVVCLRKLNIVGSVVGTLKDVEEALDFTARGLVYLILTKGILKDVDKFCQLMIAETLAGMAVLKVSA
ncbi:hypothetical protein DL95DRAFT_510188 [Leptodontidium sp. 2 PMI_412]|nr:hypothetical protein DL95DRAFT_510188 [Leptodontidium sp. 2 PMI_412]